MSHPLTNISACVRGLSRSKYRALSAVLVLVLASFALLAGGYGRLVPVNKPGDYPYQSPQFTRFIEDSYRYQKRDEPAEFYRWMDAAYSKSPVRLPNTNSPSFKEAVDKNARIIASMTGVEKKTQAEIELSARLHKLIKNIIPRFSLDRGFEFTNTVILGERQCFLQSVVIAGVLQKTGVNAGVVMVYRSISGDESNNGHAVVLVKLPNGRDLIVDASDPVPFVEQKGLFVYDNGYKYVKPVYDTTNHQIRYYTAESNGRKIPASRVRTLDYNFICSQFYYYRGERAPGGVFAEKKTTAGLQSSVKALRQSVRLSPGNPLAVYMLGRAVNALGKTDKADPLFIKAHRLYNSYGWLPAGPKDTYTLARSR